MIAGHNDKDCTYTLMEESSKKIVSIVMVNKLQTQNISNNMEYVGFVRAMQEVTEMKLKTVEIVTDSHTQITSKICKYFDVT